jgi:hypothetical protein
MTDITESALARMEVDIVRWQQGQISAEEVAAIMETDLPALIAYVRELRGELKDMDDANTALGSQVIDLMRERDEAWEGLEPFGQQTFYGSVPDDARVGFFRVGDLRRAARIVEEAKG